MIISSKFSILHFHRNAPGTKLGIRSKILPVSSDEQLMVTLIAGGEAGCNSTVSFIALPSNLWIKKEVIVVVRNAVGGLSVKGFGDETKWLEVAEHRQLANARRHFLVELC